VEEGVWVANGGRKSSTAFVRLKPGSGKIIVNRRAAGEYFGRQTLLMLIEQPFRLTQTLGEFDVVATVKGGGLSGQAGAIRLAVARALLAWNQSLRNVLKSAGFLTRDPREKERKKYGLAGARKRYQFSKR